jgi:hypothetical protein
MSDKLPARRIVGLAISNEHAVLETTIVTLLESRR